MVQVGRMSSLIRAAVMTTIFLWTTFAAQPVSAAAHLEAGSHHRDQRANGGHGFRVLIVTAPASPVYASIAVAEELQSRGHEVQVASLPNVRAKVEKAGVKFLSLGEPLPKEAFDEVVQGVVESYGKPAKLAGAGKMFSNMNRQMAEELELVYPHSAESPSDRNLHLDLVVFCTLVDQQILSFAQSRSIPHLLLLPSVAIPLAVSNAPYVPIPVLGLPLHNKTFVQRVQALGVRVIFEGFAKFASHPMLDIAKIVRNFKGLILVASLPGFDYPAHLPPLVQYTGPIVSRKRILDESSSSSILSDEVRSFMDRVNDARPIVYISFGSIAKLTPSQVVRIATAVRPTSSSASSDWRVVWALQDDLHQHLPDFVLSEKDDFVVANWIETPAVLAHPKIGLFLSHCGANGVHESLSLGVPVVGLPFFGDQVELCNRLISTSTGTCLFPPMEKHDPNEIRQALVRVLEDPTYRQNMSAMRHLLSRYPGAEKAADWAELVAQLKGDVSMFQTPVDREGFVKAFYVDVLLLMLAAVVVSTFLLGRMCGRRRGAEKRRKSS